MNPSKKISLIVIGIVSLTAAAAHASTTLKDAYNQARHLVQTKKISFQSIPDVTSGVPEDQMIEKWDSFKNCREIMSESLSPRLTIGPTDADPVLVMRVLHGSIDGRDVSVAEQDMQVTYNLSQNHLLSKQAEHKVWQEHNKTLGGLISHAQFFDPNILITYEEQITPLGLVATITNQYTCPDNDPSAAICYERFSSDGRYLSLIAFKKAGITDYIIKKTCGNGFGFQPSLTSRLAGQAGQSDPPYFQP